MAPENLTTLFKAMRLHQQPYRADFDTNCPFQETARIEVSSSPDLFGCAFNPYADPEDDQMVAIAGADGINVYNIPLDTNRIDHVWGCSFGKVPKHNKSESLYTVAWAYDTFEAEHGRNPYKLVTGGAGSHLYVIDFKTKAIENHLLSFGGEINDIRVCPSNSNIVATACSDESVRIHHIRNQSPLITCGGLRTHMGAILSVDWHSSGDYIVSCGFDHQILKWDLSVNPAKGWLDKACEELARGQRNIYFQPGVDDETAAPEAVKMKKPSQGDDRKDIAASLHAPTGNYMELFTPVAICSDLHSDYVDCIRMLPGSDLFASKATGSDRHINIAKFGLPAAIKQFKDRVPCLEPELAQTNIKWFKNSTGESWFVKFAVDPQRRWIVSGSNGRVSFFDMRKRDTYEDHSCVHHFTPSHYAIRHVDFSPCGRLLVGCTDYGIIFRVDRVSSDVAADKFAKFRAKWNAL